eukprot:6170537-Alexandrium_andersonii.AAC.1
MIQAYARAPNPAATCSHLLISDSQRDEAHAASRSSCSALARANLYAPEQASGPEEGTVCSEGHHRHHPRTTISTAP